MTGDGDLLLRFLRLTGWRVEAYEDDSGKVAAFAERPPGLDGPAVRVTASGRNRSVGIALFEQACEHMYGRRPTFDVPPDHADTSLFH